MVGFPRSWIGTHSLCGNFAELEAWRISFIVKNVVINFGFMFIKLRKRYVCSVQWLRILTIFFFFVSRMLLFKRNQGYTPLCGKGNAPQLSCLFWGEVNEGGTIRLCYLKKFKIKFHDSLQLMSFCILIRSFYLIRWKT